MGTLARSGLVGLILGLIAVAVIRPLVPAAGVLIVGLCIAIAAAAGSTIGAIRHRATAASPKPKHDPGA